MKTTYQNIAAALLITIALFTGNRAAAQTSGPLFNEIARMDSLQFTAFNARNLDQLMNYFDQTLELYQDNTGVRNFDQTKQAFGGLFKMNYVLNRKLIPGTMEVYPIKDYGAIETGQHSFSHMENGQLQSFTFKFMQIWQKKDGVWRVTREITYGH
ncbi:MAG: nuclear transport factor 2 family protein [Mucilaginibacter sp.]